MRARLIFEITDFPLAYRLIIVSFIKDAIHSQSKSFYKTFFLDNERQTKPYAFSAYFKNFRLESDQIIADEMSVTISASSYEFLMYLFNGSQENKQFSYKGKTRMILKKFELLKERNIRKSRLWMRTLSPILVENQEGKPVLAEDPAFEKELNIIAGKMMRSSAGRALYQPLKIIHSHLRKVVIKENFHQTQASYLYFTANKGDFLIEGDPRDLNNIYQNGLSLRTQLGFGLIDVLG